MSLFNDILQKLSQSIAEKSDNKELIAKTLSEGLGISINPDMVSVAGKKIYIKSAPTIKLALKMKESELVRLLQEKGISIVSIG